VSTADEILVHAPGEPALSLLARGPLLPLAQPLASSRARSLRPAAPADLLYAPLCACTRLSRIPVYTVRSIGALPNDLDAELAISRVEGEMRRYKGQQRSKLLELLTWGSPGAVRTRPHRPTRPISPGDARTLAQAVPEDAALAGAPDLRRRTPPSTPRRSCRRFLALRGRIKEKRC
jgi:hypothetical protein